MRAPTDDIERIDVEPSSPWWAEHRARYHLAARYVTGADALDLACGSGLGAPVLLAAGANRLVGFELSHQALEVAARFRSDRFLPGQADGTRIPARNGTFGVITSFETVEHIPDDERFVRELARVLRPEGLLLLSTPNALHTKPADGVPANPFHVREYTPQELQALLGRAFADVRLLGQQPDAQHRPCPYWQSPEAVRGDFRSRVVAASWKAHGRLPAAVRDRSWTRLHGRSYFPGEHDFEFTPQAVRHGHVLVALCRAPLTTG